MATVAEVRARVRRMLEDTDPAAQVWADAELDDWLGVAAREYGARFPREAVTTIAAVGGQTAYPLPVDARRVLRVECPAGQPVPRRAPSVGPAPGTAQSWAHFGGAIDFGLPPGAAIVVRYRGPYPWPASDAGVVTLPDEGVDLVVLGTTILALQRREVATGKRRGGGGGVATALEVARRMYAEALGRCRVARGETLG